MATNLALAFLALCLASCLAPADAHACCRGAAPTISAAADDCCLDTDGVRSAADGIPVHAGAGAFVLQLAPKAPPSRIEGGPCVAASPPLILRV
jgi:hypothetical protein